MEYRSGKVSYRSDKSEGPTARTETLDPLEFLARVLTHIADKRQVMTRYYRMVRQPDTRREEEALQPTCLELTGRSQASDLQIHRGLVQPTPKAFRPRPTITD
jgi:hypothetical protein